MTLFLRTDGSQWVAGVMVGAYLMRSRHVEGPRSPTLPEGERGETGPPVTRGSGSKERPLVSLYCLLIWHYTSL